MKKYTEKCGSFTFFESICWFGFFFFTFKSQQLPNSLKCSELYLFGFSFLYQQLKNWNILENYDI